MAPSAKAPLAPAAVLGLLKEIRAGAEGEKPIAVGGARELAAALRRDLSRGGVASAVREGPPEGAAALVYVLAGAPDREDEEALRAAWRVKVPAVAVLAGPPSTRPRSLPYVKATELVEVGSGGGFPVDEIAHRLAAVLGEQATPLAARLPVLRGPVCEQLTAAVARQNAVVGAAVFVPGADMPVLTLNQIRLVLRIADAHGFEIDRERLPEILGVIAGAYGLRSAARQVLGLIPVAGWALKGGIAYGGTRAIGEAARRYFESRAPVTRVAGDRARF